MCTACLSSPKAHLVVPRRKVRLFAFGAKAAPAGHLEAVEAARQPFEDDFIVAAYDVLLAQGEAAAAALEAEGEFAAEAAVTELRDSVARLYQGLYGAVWPAFAAGVFDGLKSWLPSETKRSHDVWLEQALAWVEENAGILITGVQDTTRGAIRTLIAKGLEDGLGSTAIAAEIREVWPEIAAYRAERVARTEIARASSVGSLSGARSIRDATGLQLDKVWLATVGDARTRPTHAEANGQRVGLDEPFTVGGYEADYPSDPALPAAESVLCRCCLYFEVG